MFARTNSMAPEVNITDKVYRRLSLLVSPERFSYCVTDTLTGKILHLNQIDFVRQGKTGTVEELYADAFTLEHQLTQHFDEVVVVHDNNLSAFVPEALFDAAYLGSYLQYNVKVFDTDYFDFDPLPNYSMNNVYIPFVNLNNFLIDRYGVFNYSALSSVLVARLLERTKNQDERQMFAHVSPGRFELVVIQNQKLLLYNSFEIGTPEDFIYYLLFTAEQLNLNPENFNLFLLGDVTQESDIFKIAWKYVRNVSLLDVCQMHDRNGLSEEENRQHFILLGA
jgi:hypothetical protein